MGIRCRGAMENISAGRQLSSVEAEVYTRALTHCLRGRLSVLSAITSTQQSLKLYNKVPPNGLVLYCGTILTEDGKEKQVPIL